MEAFRIMGFTFDLAALSKIIMLEKRLNEYGVLKEKKNLAKTKYLH